MSAAMRELRPVEIVGLYEDVAESLEVRLPASHIMGGRHGVMLLLCFDKTQLVDLKALLPNCILLMAG